MSSVICDDVSRQESLECDSKITRHSTHALLHYSSSQQHQLDFMWISRTILSEHHELYYLNIPNHIIWISPTLFSENHALHYLDINNYVMWTESRTSSELSHELHLNITNSIICISPPLHHLTRELANCSIEMSLILHEIWISLVTNSIFWNHYLSRSLSSEMSPILHDIWISPVTNSIISNHCIWWYSDDWVDDMQMMQFVTSKYRLSRTLQSEVIVYSDIQTIETFRNVTNTTSYVNLQLYTA